MLIGAGVLYVTTKIVLPMFLLALLVEYALISLQFNALFNYFLCLSYLRTYALNIQKFY
jgi:hypothetical protein